MDKKKGLTRGDSVIDLSNPELTMIVEEVKGGKVICSVKDPKTMASRLDTFDERILLKRPGDGKLS
jgi:hypothetical protein